MRIKMPGGKVVEGIVSEGRGGELAIVLGVVKAGPDGCDGFELVEADAAELAALQGAGYGRTLVGVDELLAASRTKR